MTHAGINCHLLLMARVVAITRAVVANDTRRTVAAMLPIISVATIRVHALYLII